MGSPDGGPGTTAANYAALDTIKNRFNDLGAAFRNSKTPLGQSYDKAIAAAGQFAPQLQPGAVKFMLAWRETFEVCDDCACLIAGNIGKTAVDLKAVDIDGDLTITL